MTSTSKKKDLKAIEDLANHPGWALAVSVMREEILSAAIQLGSIPTMSESELHFRRASIFAANALINLPEKLKQKLISDISILEFQEMNKTATKQPSPR